jgi:DNA-directed RNA polymerase subunit RPC12/RpoP
VGAVKQLSLLGKAPRSRPRRKLMHVVDAGHGELDLRVRFGCARCGIKTLWTTVENITEAKRGLPCPKCSP